MPFLLSNSNDSRENGRLGERLYTRTVVERGKVSTNNHIGREMEYEVVAIEGFSRITRWEGYQKQGARNVGISRRSWRAWQTGDARSDHAQVDLPDCALFRMAGIVDAGRSKH